MLAEQWRWIGGPKVSMHMILRISFQHLFSSILFSWVSPRELTGGYKATSPRLHTPPWDGPTLARRPSERDENTSYDYVLTRRAGCCSTGLSCAFWVMQPVVCVHLCTILSKLHDMEGDCPFPAQLHGLAVLTVTRGCFKYEGSKSGSSQRQSLQPREEGTNQLFPCPLSVLFFHQVILSKFCTVCLHFESSSAPLNSFGPPSKLVKSVRQELHSHFRDEWGQCSQALRTSTASSPLPFRTGWAIEKLIVVLLVLLFWLSRKEKERERKHGMACFILMGRIAGLLWSELWILNLPPGQVDGYSACEKWNLLTILKYWGDFSHQLEISSFSSLALDMAELPAGWSLWWQEAARVRVAESGGGRVEGRAQERGISRCLPPSFTPPASQSTEPWNCVSPEGLIKPQGGQKQRQVLEKWWRLNLLLKLTSWKLTAR